MKKYFPRITCIIPSISLFLSAGRKHPINCISLSSNGLDQGLQTLTCATSGHQWKWNRDCFLHVTVIMGHVPIWRSEIMFISWHRTFHMVSIELTVNAVEQRANSHPCYAAQLVVGNTGFISWTHLIARREMLINCSCHEPKYSLGYTK